MMRRWLLLAGCLLHGALLQGCGGGSSDRPAQTSSSGAVTVMPAVEEEDEPLPDRGDSAATESGTDPFPAREYGSLGGPGWLGVELEAMPSGQAGVAIRDVLPGSPAFVAGLQAGDVLLRVDNASMTAPRDVVEAISAHRAGERVGLVLRRSGKERLIAVNLASKPDRDEVMRMSFVDQPTPELGSVRTVQGTVPSTLAAMRGEVIVLEFWEPWCQVCRMMVPTLNRWHGKFAGQGVRVLGVTSTGVVPATRTVNQLGMQYDIVSDASGGTTKTFRAGALPTLFVIDRAGVVRDVIVGYDSDSLRRAEALVSQLVAAP